MQVRTTLLAFISAASLVVAGNAQAGCGCDHPPPDWAQVMPPFGSPGKMLTIYPESGQFTVGETYSIQFGSRSAHSVAAVSNSLQVAVPPGTNVGPVEIRVEGPGYSHTYHDSMFTAMANPRKIKPRDGVFKANNYKAAVTSDGTLLLPFDMRSVLDPTQFIMGFRDLALAYDVDDVVIYNADGVDLTLFTADVSDPTARQWGSYYGWTVESDSGLPADHFLPKVHHKNGSSALSNLFTYWRHEFVTYRDAHAPGGTHEVDTAGLHPDSTLHVDHYNLVIAIRGLERNSITPAILSLATPLEPGMRQVDLAWVSVKTANPIEVIAIAPLIEGSNDAIAEMLEEVLLLED